MTPQTPSSQPAGVSFYIWIISSVRLISIYSFVSNACSMSAMDRVNKAIRSSFEWKMGINEEIHAAIA